MQYISSHEKNNCRSNPGCFFSPPQILKNIPELADSCTPPEELPRHQRGQHAEEHHETIKRFLQGPSNYGTPMGLILLSYHSQSRMPWNYVPNGKQGDSDMGRPCGGSHRTGRFLEKFLQTPLAEPINLSLWLDGMFSGTALTSEKRFSHQRSSARSFSNGTTMNLDFKKKYCKPYKMYNEAQIFQTRSKSGSMDIYNSFNPVYIYIYHIIAYFSIFLINSQNPRILLPNGKTCLSGGFNPF